MPEDPADGAPDWVRALEDARRSDPRPGTGPVVITDPRPDGSLDLDPDAGAGRGWWRHRDRLEQALAASVPGPRLATLLAEVDPTQSDDDSVVDLAQAAAWMASWSHALLVRIAGELAALPSMNPTWPSHVPSPSQPNIAADELAIRLAVSRRGAQKLVDHAGLFATTLTATGDALSAGRIDPARAAVLTDCLADQAPDVAAEVEDRVLPTAEHRTPTQLRRAGDPRTLDQLRADHLCTRVVGPDPLGLCQGGPVGGVDSGSGGSGSGRRGGAGCGGPGSDSVRGVHSRSGGCRSASAAGAWLRPGPDDEPPFRPLATANRADDDVPVSTHRRRQVGGPPATRALRVRGLLRSLRSQRTADPRRSVRRRRLLPAERR